MRKIVWMFSGQGSQYYGMGRGLYETDQVFRNTMDRCDEVAGRLGGESLLRVLFQSEARDRFADFVDLRHTHPALFAVQYSLAQTLLHRGMKPDLLLGYSLGEMIAAAVAGAFSLESILELLINQARLLASSAGTGAMLAILESPDIWDACDPLFADTWIAARNARQHFVLSGLPAAIERVAQRLHHQDILHQRLPVTVAFHSPLLETVERAFREKMDFIAPQELAYPLVSAAYLTQLTRLPSGFFWEVARRPVRFQETISWLEGRGGADYIDLGPFGTLASFLKHGLAPASTSRAYPLMTPFHRSQDTLRRIETVFQEVYGAADRRHHH